MRIMRMLILRKPSTILKKSLLFFLFFILLLHAISAQDIQEQIAKAKSTIKKLEGPINTEYIEYAPTISADGKTMIFESNQHGGKGWKLFESRLVNGQWTAPVPIEKINNFGRESDLIGGPSISYDGNTLYFFAFFEGGMGIEDIYFSERIGDEWSEPQNIGAPINTAGYEGFPSISADEKTLYFLRLNQDDDIRKEYEDVNCFIIYRSQKQPDGTWGKPTKLPYPVNLGCEKAPRIMADNRTMIFASFREGSTGSFDLYQSRRTIDGEWAQPVNLEFVNTPESDQFASISAAGDLMYFVTLDDIYTVEIPPYLRQFKNITVQGFVTSAEGNEPLEANIKVTDALTSEPIFNIRSNASDGRYTVVLAAGRSYNILVEKENYSSYAFSYDFTSLDAYDEVEKNVELFSNARINLNIYDDELYENLDAEIVIRQDNNPQIYRRIVNIADNMASSVIEVPVGHLYKLDISSEHFKSKSFTYDLRGVIRYRDFQEDVPLEPVKIEVPLNVADISNNQQVNARIVITNKDRNEQIEVTGNQMVTLRVGDRYQIETSGGKGYFYASSEVEVSENGIRIVSGEDMETRDGQIKVALKKIEKDIVIDLNDIYFETNSAELSDESYDELQRVLMVMEKNPAIKVEISAHTDDVGSEKYNLILSEKRAQSVVDYLKQANVLSDRLIARGYGEEMPKVENDSDENRALNRRVELKILEIM